MHISLVSYVLHVLCNWENKVVLYCIVLYCREKRKLESDVTRILLASIIQSLQQAVSFENQSKSENNLNRLTYSKQFTTKTVRRNFTDKFEK